MSGTSTDDAPDLVSGVVLRVREDGCDVVVRGSLITAGYAPSFPSPRTERVSPGHRVALATRADGTAVVLWRWYDAVVVGIEGRSIRLWEPAHGEVLATPRATATGLEPGSRAYASAGLPGAEWWVAGAVSTGEVELDEIAALYAEHGLWDAALASGS